MPDGPYGVCHSIYNPERGRMPPARIAPLHYQGTEVRVRQVQGRLSSAEAVAPLLPSREAPPPRA